MQHRTFPSPHGSIHYLHWPQKGQSKPLLHFAHATGFNAYTYQSILDPLAKYFEIFALDLRGHGGNQCPAHAKEFQSWDVYTQDLYSFLAQFNEPFILSGHSLGSLVSLALAAKHPDMVDRLVLFEPVLFPYSTNFFLKCLKALKLGGYIPLAKQAKKRRARWQNKEQIFAAYHRKGAFASWPDHILKDYIDAAFYQETPNSPWELSCKPEWESQSFALTSTSSWQYLRMLSCPTKIVYGDHASTVSHRTSQILKTDYPHIERVKIDHSSHFLPMEKTKTFQDEMMCFMDTKHTQSSR